MLLFLCLVDAAGILDLVRQLVGAASSIVCAHGRREQARFSESGGGGFVFSTRGDWKLDGGSLVLRLEVQWRMFWCSGGWKFNSGIAAVFCALVFACQ